MISAINLPQPPAWTDQMGWALVHSIWQIALITAVYALIVFSLRHATASARYLVGCAALFLMLAVPVGTFVWLGGQTRPATSTATTALVSPGFASTENGDSSSDSATIPIGSEGETDPIELGGTPDEWLPESPLESTHAGTRGAFLANWVEGIEPFLPWLILSWLAGALILSLRPLWGWFTVRRLQTQGHCPLSAEIEKLTARLIDRMAIRQAVACTQSALVVAPTVVGHLRPIVLLPASAITGLTSAQLEMILAHELAHVRRYDYLVNAAQTIVESLLFFHPGVWWVSAQVRRERENCCDDIAVAVCGDRATYMRALFSLETLCGKIVAPAVAATGGSLVARIRRLAGPPVNTELTMRRNAAWLGGLLVVLAMSVFVADLTYQVAVADNPNVVTAEAEDSETDAIDTPTPETSGSDTESGDPQSSDPESVREAIAEIERLGGSYDRQKSATGAGPIVSISLQETAADDTTLEKLAPLVDVTTLILSQSKITDAGLKHLRNMKKLAWVEMDHTNITGPGLENFAGMDHLLTLRLTRTKVDDASLVHVMPLKALRSLSIERTNVTQAGVRELWAVRPSLEVKGVRNLERGDAAAVAILLSEAKKLSAVEAKLSRQEAADRVKGAMWARDNRVKSFLFHWSEVQRDQPGTLWHRDDSLGNGPVNRDEVVYEVTKKLLVSGRILRYESDGVQPKVDENGDVTLPHVIYRNAFDGTFNWWQFEYPGGDTYPQTSRRLAGLSDSVRLASTEPLLQAFSTFDRAMSNMDWNRIEVLDEPVEIGGSRCVVLKQDLLPMAIGGSEQQPRPSKLWYIDPERDYVIVRREYRYAGERLGRSRDIVHTEDPQWGWLPNSWTYSRYDSEGKLESTIKSTVTHYEINPTLPPETFQLTFPENTHMNPN